ncbi:glycosyltransferase [candidate division KSB1 bacterium]|nr:glycosyltransferase [candidate division KSB1 bacterium]
MMMTLCDLTQAYTSAGGGIRIYIDAKREYIKKLPDWKHILIIPGESDSYEQDGNLALYQVKAPAVPKCPPYRFIIRLNKVLSILKHERPDIIELGSAYILPWAAFRYRKLQPCTIIGFYHTDFPTAYVYPLASKLLNKDWGELTERWAQRYSKMIYSACDATIVASQGLKLKLETQGIPNLKLIPLGVELDVFNQSRRNFNLRKKYLRNDTEILLVYAGRFDTEKRVNVLIDAFQRLPRDRFSLVMAGEGPLKPNLQAFSKHEKRLFILPYQRNRQELAQLLASADIYVTAGPFETFGLSILEAQASNLPVVGVRAGALIDRVPESVGKLGAVDSAEEMACNIVELSENGRHQKGEAARKLVESYFCRNMILKQLFAFYESIHADQFSNNRL